MTITFNSAKYQRNLHLYLHQNLYPLELRKVMDTSKVKRDSIIIRENTKLFIRRNPMLESKFESLFSV